jgi:hypothetical protein
MSAVEVLSRCAARGGRESDCPALTAWLEKYRVRIRENFGTAERRGKQTRLEE